MDEPKGGYCFDWTRPIRLAVQDEESDPLTDAGGYLSCGCHGSQREHSCKDKNVSEFNPADEI